MAERGWLSRSNTKRFAAQMWFVASLQSCMLRLRPPGSAVVQ